MVFPDKQPRQPRQQIGISLNKTVPGRVALRFPDAKIPWGNGNRRMAVFWGFSSE